MDDAFTLGGLTRTDGSFSKPAISVSSTSTGAAAQLMFIWSRKSQVAMLQTNSPVAMTDTALPVLKGAKIHPKYIYFDKLTDRSYTGA